jgi:hypothetical protein
VNLATIYRGSLTKYWPERVRVLLAGVRSSVVVYKMRVDSEYMARFTTSRLIREWRGVAWRGVARRWPAGLGFGCWREGGLAPRHFWAEEGIHKQFLTSDR